MERKPWGGAGTLGGMAPQDRPNPADPRTVSGARAAARQLRQEGGYSVDIHGNSPKPGEVMVSVPGHEKRLAPKTALSGRQFDRWAAPEIREHAGSPERADLLSQPGSYHGGWDAGGAAVLDVSQAYPDRFRGVSAGIRNDQDAVFEVSADGGTEIPRENYAQVLTENFPISWPGTKEAFSDLVTRSKGTQRR